MFLFNEMLIFEDFMAFSHLCWFHKKCFISHKNKMPKSHVCMMKNLNSEGTFLQLLKLKKQKYAQNLDFLPKSGFMAHLFYIPELHFCNKMKCWCSHFPRWKWKMEIRSINYTWNPTRNTSVLMEISTLWFFKHPYWAGSALHKLGWLTDSYTDA